MFKKRVKCWILKDLVKENAHTPMEKFTMFFLYLGVLD